MRHEFRQLSDMNPDDAMRLLFDRIYDRLRRKPPALEFTDALASRMEAWKRCLLNNEPLSRGDLDESAYAARLSSDPIPETRSYGVDILSFALSIESMMENADRVKMPVLLAIITMLHGAGGRKLVRVTNEGLLKITNLGERMLGLSGSIKVADSEASFH